MRFAWLPRPLLAVALILPVLARAHDHYPFSFLKTNLTHEQFIDQSFVNILGRTPTEDERTAWVATLDRGSSRWYLVRSLLDSPAYATAVGADEALVMEFTAVIQRPPTRSELTSFRGALDAGSSRSDAFLALVTSRDFSLRDVNPFYLMDNIQLRLHPSVVPSLASLLRDVREGRTEGAQLIEAVVAPSVPEVAAAAVGPVSGLSYVSGHARRSAYQAYRGYLHAHSYLSIDARNSGGTPAEAWTMARDQAHLDYMGITDHAEFLGGDRWQELQNAAVAFQQPGVFIALPGFEHSNPAMGHYCVMNTPTFVSALDRPTVQSFYDWLETQPEAVVTFNHPGSYDLFSVEFNHFRLRPTIVPVVVANEVMHSSFDSYDVGYGHQISFLDEAIFSGWRVGSVQAQDNHSKDYGIANDTRTIAYADDLTVDGIIDAYRGRRLAATEDKNLYLAFSTTDGHEMGSVLDRSARTFQVGLDDPDAEEFTEIDVYENGQVTHTEHISTTGGTWSFDLPASDHDRHVYVRVTQQDGDRAQSSPIWLTTAATGTVGVR